MPVPHHGIRLVWPGRGAPKPAPQAELRSITAGDDRIRLLHGDNHAALAALSTADTRATLVYLDPPFFTGREHTLVERKRTATGIERHESEGFDDRWSSLDEYLAVLFDRIVTARELLLPEGCLVLHVDPKTSHYLKILCDEVFGQGAFASEIVWRYRRWPAKTKNFQRVHDVLLRYVRDPAAEPRFQQLYEPLAASTLATWGTRKQRAVTDDSGRRLRSSTTKEASPGTPLGDVWDIGIIAPVAKERTGSGDHVVDPYCGSGTTLAVAARLGRRAIGIDQNRRALTLTKRRLEAQGILPHEAKVIESDCAEPAEKSRPRLRKTA
jgi:16S rRNA G966 N2-methylase RsmD